MALGRAFVFRELQTKTFLGIRNPNYSGQGDFENSTARSANALSWNPAQPFDHSQVSARHPWMVSHKTDVFGVSRSILLSIEGPIYFWGTAQGHLVFDP